ncbi:MAG: helix-hairpin-helix domain-containing protein [Planctomycetaceae bacterium]|jgi:uncharacterized protein|nr:helix-hairpin-helix domain-containing protein [Planctomycetaceae bacterium]
MVEPITINLRFLARDLGLPQEQVQSVVTLLDDGFPVPFIARYRKDQTGNLDEEILRLIDEELKSARALCERKLAILKTINSQGKLTPEFDKKIRDAKSSKRLEDLYLPFKPKRQTLASEAREHGLEPLALEIFHGTVLPENLDQRASEFINEDKKVNSIADALLGAGFIIAEMFSEKIEIIQDVRDAVFQYGKLVTTKIEPKTPVLPQPPKKSGTLEKSEKPESSEMSGKKSASKKKKEKKNRKTTDTTINDETTNQKNDNNSDRSSDQNIDRNSAANTVTSPDISKESENKTSTESTTESTIESTIELTSKDAEKTDLTGSDFTDSLEKSEQNSVEVSEVLNENCSEKTEAVEVMEINTDNTDSIEDQNVEAENMKFDSIKTEDIQTETNYQTEAGAETVCAENVAAELPDSGDQDAEVLAVTEQFRQWKKAQEEQGIPVIRSQNSIKKKKKEEIHKKRDDAQTKQQEHFERQFSDYFNFTAKLRNFPAHRILAINRGERGKVLRVKIDHDESKLLDSIRESCVSKDHPHADFLTGCLKDALHRLVVPSIEREIRNDMTEFAEKQAIRVFSRNLRNLLLQPPLYRKRVLALDPGYKHGCKMVPLDEFGNVLDFETVYVGGGSERKEKVAQKIADIIQKYKISVIAIGNGSGSRETEELISGMIASRFAGTELAYVIVNEAGASVYSASIIAREEFPDYDPLLRGAVSIGRRLQDPLNELVKIDPASLGVGMYQHDLKNKHLKNTLSNVVESCVNFAGVDLNTATPAILRYVAGLNQMTAKRIHEYRLLHGPFRSRNEIKKVAGLGEVAYTHAAGFLKIHDGQNPLDATWIHPESYNLAAQILEKLGFSVDDLKNNEKVKELANKIAESKIGELASRLSTELGVGLFTVRDILDDLARPGRDPRESLPPPIFKKGVLHIEDVTPGMELTGTVLNVVDFGAFVDIGLHESALIHISQMAERYIRDAHEKVAVGNIVRVWVADVDHKRKRVSLSMCPPGAEKPPKPEHPATEQRRESHRNEHREQLSDQSSAERKPVAQSSERHNRQHSENRHTEKTRPQNEETKKYDGNRFPRKEEHHQDKRGNQNKNRSEHGNREHSNREQSNREANSRNRVKTFVAVPKTKELKPISDKMKQGKEALRSFGDLAQFLGHIQVTDPEEEKKRKKEEARLKKNESEDS